MPTSIALISAGVISVAPSNAIPERPRACRHLARNSAIVVGAAISAMTIASTSSVGAKSVTAHAAFCPCCVVPFDENGDNRTTLHSAGFSACAPGRWRPTRRGRLRGAGRETCAAIPRSTCIEGLSSSIRETPRELRRRSARCCNSLGASVIAWDQPSDVLLATFGG